MCQPSAIFDPANDETRCVCKEAAMQAYRGLLAAGVAESIAMQAATRVYAYHHPEDPKHVASLTVERWAHAGNLH